MTEISDYKWLAGNVQLGCLSSLEQLRLWTNDDNFSSSDTTWRHLEKLEIFILSRHDIVETVISQIADACEKDRLPALRTICVMIDCPGIFVEIYNGKAYRLRQQNFYVHKGSIDDQMFLSNVGLL